MTKGDPRRLLSSRELDVLTIIAQEGLTVAEAAAKLGIAYQTAKNHLSSAYIALDVRNLTEAFIERGWLVVPPTPDRKRTRCSSCKAAHKWYELEPGSGRCDTCRS